jgi:hypothetical protein
VRTLLQFLLRRLWASMSYPLFVCNITIPGYLRDSGANLEGLQETRIEPQYNCYIPEVSQSAIGNRNVSENHGLSKERDLAASTVNGSLSSHSHCIFQDRCCRI